MAAAAAQKAPKGNNGYTPNAAMASGEKRGFKEKLHDLPQAAGIAALCVLLVLSLFAGNFRALSAATPKDFIRQGDVQSIVEDRAAQAGNIIAVAQRAGLDQADIDAAQAAVQLLKDAKTAREISRADQALMAAAAELTTAQLTGEEAGNMLRAADNFAEQGSFLRQEARDFNEKAEKAEMLYEKLPTRFLLSRPDVYEGI